MDLRDRWIDDDEPLPPTSQALGPDGDWPGLLAIGGGLNPTRLHEAYSRGVFPWFSPGQPVLWWSTDPRMVLRTDEFKLSRSLRKTIKRFVGTPGCEIRIDHDLERVMRECADAERDGRRGTWIVDEMVRAYTAWHQLGAVHSVETWIDGELAGGLYCVNLGRMVYGESMFARRTDASKIALAALVSWCRREAIEMIDCQQATAHLASLGAKEVARAAFEAHLARVVPLSAPRDWTYDRAHWVGLDASLMETEAACNDSGTASPPADPPSDPVIEPRAQTHSPSSAL
jgi:leucyl/phenylalanyl-tRNA---protein transferase